MLPEFKHDSVQVDKVFQLKTYLNSFTNDYVHYDIEFKLTALYCIGNTNDVPSQRNNG